MEATTLNVPPTVPSNLCKQKNIKFSELSKMDECTWKQGMLLLGMRGTKISSDLYTEATIKQSAAFSSSSSQNEGFGLFVRGGNPLYYTMKGTTEDVANKVHSVLRGSLDDIAGHHIVFRAELDENTLEPYMYVHRTPLSSSWMMQTPFAKDPLEIAYDASKQSTLQTGGNRGWLSNLAATMRSEQQLVDRLYPLDKTFSASSSSSSWSCPLLRIAFWSKVVADFSPLVPSPVRSARLFGNDEKQMTYGTRSHPTQLFSSVYNRLANVMTSNGFCYCVSAADCQVPHTSTWYPECTLLETIKSLYDQQYRTTQLVFPISSQAARCSKQLDWPFEPGTMRDGMPTSGENDATQPCNVLDRIPPFRYRY
jgi:hypothetical protein